MRPVSPFRSSPSFRVLHRRHYSFEVNLGIIGAYAPVMRPLYLSIRARYSPVKERESNPSIHTPRSQLQWYAPPRATPWYRRVFRAPAPVDERDGVPEGDEVNYRKDKCEEGDLDVIRLTDSDEERGMGITEEKRAREVKDGEASMWRKPSFAIMFRRERLQGQDFTPSSPPRPPPPSRGFSSGRQEFQVTQQRWPLPRRKTKEPKEPSR